MTHLKNIHIGKLIKERWEELNISMDRTCNFLKLDEKKISEMFNQNSLDGEVLLKWSKLLEYDFFRLYSQHLILYSPPSAVHYTTGAKQSTVLPQFRKNVYTKQIIDFILKLISTGEKTRAQVIEEYKIPKTTLYKWISKYSPNNNP